MASTTSSCISGEAPLLINFGYLFRELSGRLFLHSVKIKPEGHLEVEFQTQTNFYGMFAISKGTSQSTVTSHDHLQLTFDLKLTQTEQTFDNPKQMWQFISDSSVSNRCVFCDIENIVLGLVTLGQWLPAFSWPGRVLAMPNKLGTPCKIVGFYITLIR